MTAAVAAAVGHIFALQLRARGSWVGFFKKLPNLCTQAIHQPRLIVAYYEYQSIHEKLPEQGDHGDGAVTAVAKTAAHATRQ